MHLSSLRDPPVGCILLGLGYLPLTEMVLALSDV